MALSIGLDTAVKALRAHQLAVHHPGADGRPYQLERRRGDQRRYQEREARGHRRGRERTHLEPS